MIIGTVHAVTGTELTLLIDGETEPTTKTYKQTGFYIPKAGDRVTIEEINGSYVVTGTIGKCMRYTVPGGTETLDIQLEPQKMYLITWFEVYNQSSVVACRIALVGTPTSEYATTAPAYVMFAATGTQNPFSGLPNFKVRITKGTTARTGYATVMEL